MDQLAGYYLQKVRETGDPSYYPKVQALVDRVLTLSPTDINGLVLDGVVTLGRHQFSEGLVRGQRALAVGPRNTSALGIVVDAEVELGQYEEAITSVQQMIGIRPDLSSYSRVSYLRELRGDIPGAIEVMKMAVTSGGPYTENVSYVQVLLGTLYFNEGMLSEADATYSQALGGNPGYPMALAARGQLRAAQHRWPEAIADLTAAVQVYPLPQFVVALGETYEASGDIRSAGQQYDLASAEQALYVTNGVNQDQELALFDADHRRELPAALVAAQRAAHDRPSVKSFDVLAWTLYQVGGRDAEALAAATRAHALGTRDASFFYHSGMIEARMGRVADARRDLQQALDINPSFSELRAPIARTTLAGLAAS